MRRPHRYVDSISRNQEAFFRLVLILLLVSGGVVVHGPIPFKLLLRYYLPVILVKDVGRFVASDLQQETALPVDMVGGDSPRRGHKNDGILNFHIFCKIQTTSFFNFSDVAF